MTSLPGHARRDLELEWEVPFRDLGFTGVPFRTASFVMPTVNCLVALKPPLATSLTCTTSEHHRIVYPEMNFSLHTDGYHHAHRWISACTQIGGN